MKKIQSYQLFLIKAIFPVLLSVCISCVSDNKKAEGPKLNLEKVRGGLIQIDDRFRNYTNTHCNFLENSFTFVPEDIQNIHCHGNELYILFSDQLRHYNLTTGKLMSSYHSPIPVQFIDFCFDPSLQKAYLLDKKGSRLIELQLTGQQTETIKLDPTYTYSMVKQIDQKTLLIPKQTIPAPSFVIVNLERNEVDDLDFPENKDRTHAIPAGSDSIWAKYPLYVADETAQGVKIKYLFDDQVYLVTKNEITPDYIIRMGKHKLKRKYPWSKTKFKNNQHFRILKLWHGNSKTYILHKSIVKNVLGTFDAGMLSQFQNYSLVNDFEGFILQSGLASLSVNNSVFMDDECTRFLSFKKLGHKESRTTKNWPQHMLDAENKENLVLSVFYMKND